MEDKWGAMSASCLGRRPCSGGNMFIGSIFLSSLLAFAVLLYVRPYLRLAAIEPRRALRSPYYDAYWICSSFSRIPAPRTLPCLVGNSALIVFLALSHPRSSEP